MIHNNNASATRRKVLTLELPGCCARVHGAESGAPITAFGAYDFGAEVMPPTAPSGTLGLRTALYPANVQKDRHGRSVNNHFSLDVLSFGVACMHGFGAVVPFFQDGCFRQGADTSRAAEPGGRSSSNG